MDYNAKAEFVKDIESNERILWAGQPKKGVLFSAKDIFMIPFSIVWCGFAIFWLYAAFSTGATILALLFGIPIVTLGLIFVFGRFITDTNLRANTFYGITNHRIIIKSGKVKKNIKTFDIKTLPNIEYFEKKDGSGTISLYPSSPIIEILNKINWRPELTATTSLYLIQDVKRVYNIILEVQKGG